MSAQIPGGWSDVETTSWLDDSDRVVGAAILAATDVDGLYDGWDTPGVFIGVSPKSVLPAALLDSRAENRMRNCTAEGGAAFDGSGLEGEYRLSSGCGGGDTVVLDLAANARGGPGTVLVQVRLVGTSDIEALGMVMSTLRIDIESVARVVGRMPPGNALPI